MNACRPLLLLAALTLCGCDFRQSIIEARARLTACRAPMVKVDKWTPNFTDRWQPVLRLLDQPQLFLGPPPARKTYNIRSQTA